MVVRAQCCGFFPYYTIPRAYVLLYTQGIKQAGLQLQTICCSFLVTRISLYLGGAPSPLKLGYAGLGTDSGYDFQRHALGSQLGRYDKRYPYIEGCVAPATYRPDNKIFSSGSYVLRHVHLRRTASVYQVSKFPCSLH